MLVSTTRAQILFNFSFVFAGVAKKIKFYVYGHRTPLKLFRRFGSFLSTATHRFFSKLKQNETNKKTIFGRGGIFLYTHQLYSKRS